MKDSKTSKLHELRKKVAERLEKELEDVQNLSAEELFKRYPDDRFIIHHKQDEFSELFKNTKHLQIIFNTLPISIWVKDTKNNIIRVNRAAAKLAGRLVDELEGKSFDEIFPKESAKGYQNDMEVITSGKPKFDINEEVTPQGNSRWIRTDKIPWHNQEGNIAGVIVLAMDITDTKNVTEERLLLAEITRHISEGVCLIRESDGIILYSNKTFQKMFEIENEEVNVNYFSVLNAQPSEEKNKYIFNEVTQYNVEFGYWKGEILITNKEGIPYWIHTSHTRYKHPKYGKVLIAIHMDISERKQAEEKIYNNEKTLKRLTKTLADIQEMEKRKLSRVLHDEIGQSLTAVKINISSVIKKSIDKIDLNMKVRLEETNEIVDSIMSDIQSLSISLRPPMLDIFGLAPSIKSYCRKYSERTSIKIQLESVVNVKLIPEVEIAVFRIVQEALTNIAKHANAKTIKLSLNAKDQLLKLHISDDGCGFDMERLSGTLEYEGIGLISIQERVSSLKGTVEIISSSGKGTKINIQLPILSNNE